MDVKGKKARDEVKKMKEGKEQGGEAKEETAEVIEQTAEDGAQPEEEDKPMHVVRTYIMVRSLELFILQLIFKVGASWTTKSP